MSLVINGVTIPTNVANTFNFNGTNITQVIYNGTTYWQQILGLSVGFSGSTITPLGSAYSTGGISTSGFSYRAAVVAAGSGTTYGAWQSVNSQGIFSGNSSAADGIDGAGYSVNAYQIGVSSNLIRVTGEYNWSPWVTLTASTKSFSGGAAAANSSGYLYTLNTSAGLVRAETRSFTTTYVGSWISIA